MRAVFGEELVLLGAEYPQMVVLDSDTSSSTQTRLFGQAYPDRFFNCGIAEGNMLGIAGGMAGCLWSDSCSGCLCFSGCAPGGR